MIHNMYLVKLKLNLKMHIVFAINQIDIFPHYVYNNFAYIICMAERPICVL